MDILHRLNSVFSCSWAGYWLSKQTKKRQFYCWNSPLKQVAESQILKRGITTSNRVLFSSDSWLAVDPWEVTRKRIMDYMSVLEHAKEVCHETFPGHVGNITILYMCQPSQVMLPTIPGDAFAPHSLL